MPPSLVKTNPREYFAFPACDSCWEKPCLALRFGASRQGECLLVHRRFYNTQRPCPFAATSFDEIVFMLRSLSLQKLDRLLQGLVGQLPFDETLRFNYVHHLTSYLDFAGRIEYLRRLWEAQVFAAIRIPHVFDQDEKIKEWLKAPESLRTASKKEEAPAEEPEEVVAAKPTYTIKATIVRKDTTGSGKLTPLKRAKCKVTVDGSTSENRTNRDGFIEITAASSTSEAQVEVVDLGESEEQSSSGTAGKTSEKK